MNTALTLFLNCQFDNDDGGRQIDALKHEYVLRTTDFDLLNTLYESLEVGDAPLALTPSRRLTDIL